MATISTLGALALLLRRPKAGEEEAAGACGESSRSINVPVAAVDNELREPPLRIKTLGKEGRCEPVTTSGPSAERGLGGNRRLIVRCSEPFKRAQLNASFTKLS